MFDGEKLDLRFKELGDERISRILKDASKSTSLMEINLCDNEIALDGSLALAAFLSMNTTVTSLNLDLNTISFQKLAIGLKHNSTLRNLRLGFQNPDLEDFKSLFRVLKSNDTIRSLGLTDVGMKCGAAAMLADYLKSTTSLRSLFIARNPIRGMGLHHVLSSLKENTTLAELNVLGVTFDEASKSVLKNVVRGSFNFARLYFTGRIPEVSASLVRNRNLASKVAGIMNVLPKTTGAEYHKAVYELDISFWDIAALFRGGFSCLEYFHSVSKNNKINLERVFGYLFIRDYILSDITWEKCKRAKYLMIVAHPLNYAPGETCERLLLNFAAHGTASDREAETKLKFMIHNDIKARFSSKQIEQLTKNLTSTEMNYVTESTGRVAKLICRQTIRENSNYAVNVQNLSSKLLTVLNMAPASNAIN